MNRPDLIDEYEAADKIIAALPDMVEPLVWECGDTDTSAECAFGDYIIESGWKDKIGGVRWFSWVLSKHQDDFVDAYLHGTRAANMEAAKAAAQAHHAAKMTGWMKV